jgi:hypothetical protein
MRGAMITVLSLAAATSIVASGVSACDHCDRGYPGYGYIAPPAYLYSYYSSLPPTTPVARLLQLSCRRNPSAICTGQPSRTYGYYYQPTGRRAHHRVYGYRQTNRRVPDPDLRWGQWQAWHRNWY